MKRGAFTLIELLVVITIIGILASLLLPALARAKVKASRIKCVNNAGQLGKALQSFAEDNIGLLPWQLTPTQQSYHFGDKDPKCLTSIVSLKSIKLELVTPKILWSPCDAEAQASNDEAQANWRTYDTLADKRIPCSAVSYRFIEGATQGRPGTLLVTTRNLSTKDLSTARWLGADETDVPDDAMTGLNKSQGNGAFADGSARQMSDQDIGVAGTITRYHQTSSGGTYKGPASTVVISCCGGEEDDEIWYHLVGVYDRKKNQIHLYIDGQKVGSKRCTVTCPLFNPSTIGCWDSKGDGRVYHFKGKIDELSVYNRALTEGEAQSLFNGKGGVKGGLAAYYPLDGNAQDISGRGMHGVLNGAQPTEDRNNKSKSAILFDGADDYIAITKPIITRNSDSYTIAAWVMPDDECEAGMIFSDRTGNRPPNNDAYKYSLFMRGRKSEDARKGENIKQSNPRGFCFGVHQTRPWVYPNWVGQ